MPIIKPAKAPMTGGDTTRFSLVPALAQQQMYKALEALKAAKLSSASGAEIAEIAICLALGENDPVILASAAHGARLVRKGSKVVGGKFVEAQDGVLAAATLAAVGAMLSDAKATALVCAGRLDGQAQGAEDYRKAFSFASRHKLPILYVVANSLTPGRLTKKGKQELDLRKLYAEVGIPVFSVDAKDAIAAYRVATEALHNARHLRGPCVVEALTIQGKCSSEADPLDLLREYMERHGSWPL
jgi:TPP-dependent pyruvate/acetoin dehydrogenase alpha subunit